jgi:hypothetical protein
MSGNDRMCGVVDVSLIRANDSQFKKPTLGAVPLVNKGFLSLFSERGLLL